MDRKAAAGCRSPNSWACPNSNKQVRQLQASKENASRIHSVELRDNFGAGGNWNSPCFGDRSMSFPTGSANPYEAPAVDMSPVSLAEDTEFLFNDKVIAGIGKISLPNVCVVSGERTGLVRRETCLRWCSRWLTILGKILIGLVIISIAQLLPINSTFTGVGKGGSLFEMLPFFVGTGAAIGVVCVSVIGRLMGQTVTVAWSISDRVIRRIRWIWIGGIFAIMGIFTLEALLSPQGQNYWVFYAILAFFIGSNTLSFATAAGYRPLKILGSQDSLFLIGGFRKPFLFEVQRLAALRSSRESGTVPKPD